MPWYGQSGQLHTSLQSVLNGIGMLDAAPPAVPANLLPRAAIYITQLPFTVDCLYHRDAHGLQHLPVRSMMRALSASAAFSASALPAAVFSITLP